MGEKNESNRFFHSYMAIPVGITNYIFSDTYEPLLTRFVISVSETSKSIGGEMHMSGSPIGYGNGLCHHTKIKFSYRNKNIFLE